MDFCCHPLANSYVMSVRLAIEERTPRQVTSIDRALDDATADPANQTDQITLTLDQAPAAATLSECDDILAATERTRQSQSGPKLVYALSDPPHQTFAERITATIADDGALGESRSGVRSAALNVSVTPGSGLATVTLPQQAAQQAAQQARNRTRAVMLAFGRIEA